MTNFQDFLHKSHSIQERFNSKGEFIRDNNPSSSREEPSPEEKEKLKSLRITGRPNMTYAERDRVEGAKTEEQKEQERQRRMELARKMLQNP